MNRETRMPLADGRPLIEATTLKTYSLQLIGPPHGREFKGISPLILREAEENLTDLLPPGFSVQIREWDE